jgi:CubicO group peptidase (beta-lactamase class C family)
MPENALSERLAEVLAEVEPGEPGFGAGVAVAKDGALLAEAWLGEAAPGRPWRADTPIVTWSVSKGLAAMVVARLAQDGDIDPAAPIHSYWDGFGAAGQTTTLADVMTHRAGLPLLPAAPGLPRFDDAASWDDATAAEALARTPPEPGLVDRVAYHALTYGWLVGECVRRATGLGLDAQTQRVLAEPHGLALGFGTRSARIRDRLARPGVPRQGREKCASVDAAFADPDNLLRQALCVPAGLGFADVLRLTEAADFLAAETPAISLISDAASLARAYSIFAAGAPSLISPAGRDAMLRERARTDDDDVTGGARIMALGVALNSPPSIELSPGPRSFGHPGMGGSLAWGDPDSGLGFAYLTNAAIPDTVTDPRAVALSRVARAFSVAS